MIKRIWHGWTSHAQAESYEDLLRSEVFPGIEAKNIPGYRSIELLRRDHEEEVEFITIMTFDSIQNVVDFQGADYHRCYVPEAAQKILTRWDKRSAHYDVKEMRNY
jgi:heme-degrading monooxygenase HmoA